MNKLMENRPLDIAASHRFRGILSLLTIRVLRINRVEVHLDTMIQS